MPDDCNSTENFSSFHNFSLISGSEIDEQEEDGKISRILFLYFGCMS